MLMFFSVVGLSIAAAVFLICVLLILGYALEPSANREWARKRADLRNNVERMKVEDRK